MFRVIVPKRNRQVYFDTSPCFLPEKLFHTSANDVQQLIRNRLLAALVVLLRQILNQLIGIVRGSLHGKHTCRVLGSVRIQQDRIIFWLNTLGRSSATSWEAEGSTI